MDAMRKKFTPEAGQNYFNRGGGAYQCLSLTKEPYHAIMRNIDSGWTILVHDCGIYPDGTIDWCHSTEGHFAKESDI